MPLLPTTTWGSGRRLVLCHGFTQTARSWGPFGEALGLHRSIVAVDLPGHGNASDFTGDLVNTAHALLDTVGDEPFDLLGYSMGARLSLIAAMMQPEQLGALILIGGTPGIASDQERLERRAADEVLAQELDNADDADDVGAFLDKWLAQPIFEGLTSETAQRAERLRNTPQGLARSLRTMGTGTMQSAWGFLDVVAVPTLLLAGEEDHKFTQIAHAMDQELVQSTVAVAPGVGHACHLQAPQACAQVVLHWLEVVHASANPSARKPPTTS